MEQRRKKMFLALAAAVLPAGMALFAAVIVTRKAWHALSERRQDWLLARDVASKEQSPEAAKVLYRGIRNVRKGGMNGKAEYAL